MKYLLWTMCSVTWFIDHLILPHTQSMYTGDTIIMLILKIRKQRHRNQISLLSSWQLRRSRTQRRATHDFHTSINYTMSLNSHISKFNIPKSARGEWMIATSGGNSDIRGLSCSFHSDILLTCRGPCWWAYSFQTLGLPSAEIRNAREVGGNDGQGVRRAHKEAILA